MWALDRATATMDRVDRAASTMDTPATAKDRAVTRSSSDNKATSSDNNRHSSSNNEVNSDNIVTSMDNNDYESGTSHEKEKAANVEQSPHKKETIVNEFALKQETENLMRVAVALILNGSIDRDIAFELVSAVDVAKRIHVT
jgi:hypothetical protein